MEKVREKVPHKQESAAKSTNRLPVILIAVIAILIIAALVAVIVLLLKREPEVVESGPTPAGYVRGTVLTEDNVEEVLAQRAEPVAAGYYNCTMNMEWHFEDSSKASYDAYVLNSTMNTHTVYFDVNLEETNELVYSSLYIPVGLGVDEIQLSSALEAGVYPAIVTYHLVDEDNNELSTVAVTVTLYIEN